VLPSQTERNGKEGSNLDGKESRGGREWIPWREGIPWWDMVR
jgi:hypothetical protein